MCCSLCQSCSCHPERIPTPDTHFFKYLQFICETQDFHYIESVISLQMHGNPKFPTFLLLETKEDGYEVKFRLNYLRLVCHLVQRGRTRWCH